MAISKIEVVFLYDIEKVWNIMTSLNEYLWRSDISKIEVKNEKEFIEYTKEGFETRFTVTCQEYCKRWEFDMENTNMKGHWSGEFLSEGSGTKVILTEDVTAKKIVMRPFVKGYLKKQQATYIADLKKRLNEV